MDTLELTLDGKWTEHDHDAEPVRDGRLVVGIASAKEMGVTPGDRKNAAVVALLDVEDVRAWREPLQRVVTDEVRGLRAVVTGAAGRRTVGAGRHRPRGVM